jgi:predicted DNA-binding transcriptional regulator YafY
MRPQKPSTNGHQRADAERRTRQTERLARVLRLLLLIQSPRSRDARELAEKLGCSARTVYRDLQVLVAAGVPVYFDEHNRCYRVRKAWRLAAMSPSDLA